MFVIRILQPVATHKPKNISSFYMYMKGKLIKSILSVDSGY